MKSLRFSRSVTKADPLSACVGDRFMQAENAIRIIIRLEIRA